MDFSQFEYMQWAKKYLGGVRWNLSWSGMSTPGPELFQPSPECLSLQVLKGPCGEGELFQKIAQRYGVQPDQVIASFGASQSMYLLFAVLLSSGDRVLVETPVYEPIHRVPSLFGAQVEFFERRLDQGLTIDFSRLEQALQKKTKLFVLTHLHNPSGVGLQKEEIERAGKMMAAQGGFLLVNEIYREFLLGEKSASLLGSNIFSMASLTKAYGLGALRLGWTMGPADWIEKMKYFNDYLNVNLPAPSTRIAIEFFDKIHACENRIRAIKQNQRKVLQAWLENEPRVECVLPAGGIICFPKLKGIQNTREFAQRLREKYDVAVVPGEFFRAPGHLRIGFGAEPEIVEEGLRRISQALSD